MKISKITGLIVAVLILCTVFTACTISDTVIETNVVEISKYGHAVLEINRDEFHKSGFSLGDTVTVEVNGFKADMPYLDGYYVAEGEYVLYGSESKNAVSVCINFGEFNLVSGAEAGDTVKITIKDKGGYITLQEEGSLRYTDLREDYASDEVFANFRMLSMGNIAPGKLYRSASPINNEHGRASYSNALAESTGIATIVNLADSHDDIEEYISSEDFNSNYYMDLYNNGSVILLDMAHNMRSPEYGKKIVDGLVFMSENDAPYLFHCTEGKDRAGFMAVIINALMGASADEICADYMLTYKNYYGLTSDSDSKKYTRIRDGYVMEMLRFIAGKGKGESIDGIDLSLKTNEYLLNHGMPQDKIDALKNKLSA